MATGARRMTKAELRYRVQQTGSRFFDRKTMRFSGDTMDNYGCSSKPIEIVASVSGETRKVYALWRKRPVKHGLCSSAFFDAETFERVHPRKDT